MSNSNSPRHCVILVPGLGDNIYKLEWVKSLWKQNNIHLVIHTAPWNKKNEKLEPKLDRLLKKIDELHTKGYIVSLVGTSAGGSLIINAFSNRKNKIHRVINVCGRVRKGEGVSPSLEIAGKGFPAFAKSVITCEKEIPTFNAQDRKKIMCVRPFLFDAIVPMDCIFIEGTTNITVPIFFHMFGIGAALSIFRKRLIEFIKEV